MLDVIFLMQVFTSNQSLAPALGFQYWWLYSPPNLQWSIISCQRYQFLATGNQLLFSSNQLSDTSVRGIDLTAVLLSPDESTFGNEPSWLTSI